MSTQHDTRSQDAPAWFADIDMCHIDDGSGGRALCGDHRADGPITCEEYDGQAICQTCGRPTCPRCAQLAELDMQLESW